MSVSVSHHQWLVKGMEDNRDEFDGNQAVAYRPWSKSKSTRVRMKGTDERKMRTSQGCSVNMCVCGVNMCMCMGLEDWPDGM